ncbi:unnamed protein product, partial [Mucor fragilis]
FEDLVEAYPEEPKTFDSYLHTLVQLKFRKSWDRVFIKLLQLNHQDKDRTHLDRLLMDKLPQFEELDCFKISCCDPPTYAYMDNILVNWAESLETLKIGTLNTKQWKSALQDINPNTSIQEIKKLIMGDHVMQYLIRISKSRVLRAQYWAGGKRKVFWGDLKQLLAVAGNVSFHVGFGTSKVKAEIVKCLQFLKELECKFYALEITLWNMDLDQKPEPP